MVQYKFTYFDATGMGEVSRFLFAYGGIKYEDIRIQIDDFYKNLKKDLPFGLLPVLEVDGKKIAQSLAIARYLAGKVGLYGKDAWENLLINEAVGHIDDFRLKIGIAYWETDLTVKATKLAQVKAEHIPYYLKKFDELLGKNGGHFALGKFTLADIFFASLPNYLNFLTGTKIFEGYPNLLKLIADVESLPGIKEWIKNRPVGIF